jgi:hypothetical protein
VFVDWKEVRIRLAALKAKTDRLNVFGQAPPVSGMEDFPSATDFHGRKKYRDNREDLAKLEVLLTTKFPDETVDGLVHVVSRSPSPTASTGVKRRRGRPRKVPEQSSAPRSRPLKRRKPLPKGCTFVCTLKRANPQAYGFGAGKRARGNRRGVDPAASPALFVTNVGVDNHSIGKGSSGIDWSGISGLFEPAVVMERSQSYLQSPTKRRKSDVGLGGGGGSSTTPRSAQVVTGVLPQSAGASKKKKDPVFVPRWYRVEEGKEEGSRAGSAPSLDLSELDDGIVAARHTVHLEEMKVAYESAKKEAKLKKEKEKEERSKARGGAARGR